MLGKYHVLRALRGKSGSFFMQLSFFRYGKLFSFAGSLQGLSCV